MDVVFLTAKKMSFLGGMYTVQFNHKAGAGDFSRVEKGQAHFLADHRGSIENTLGDIKSAMHNTRQSKAVLSLYDIDDPLINKARHMYENEGFKGLSAGMTELGDIEEVDRNSFMVMSWQLGEISATPLPRNDDTQVKMSEGGLYTLSDELVVVCDSDSGVFIPNGRYADKFKSKEKRVFAMPEEFDPNLFTNALEQFNATVAKLNEKLEEKEVEPTLSEEPVEETKEEPKEEEVTEMTTPASDPRIDKAVEVALSQDCFEAEAVRKLHLDAVLASMSFEDFGAKLKTLQIVPDPIAPNDSKEQSYNFANMLLSVVTEDTSHSPYEHAISMDIMKNHMLGMPSKGSMAVPYDELKKLNTKVLSSGTGSAQDAVAETPDVFIRADVPDPLNLDGLYYEVPMSAGNSNIVRVAVPDPQMVPEPDDNGYQPTGSASAGVVTLVPHLLVVKMLLSRVSRVQLPQLLQNIMMIAMAKMKEKETYEMVKGDGTSDQITGVYDYAGVGTSGALTAVAGVTGAVVEQGIQTSFAMPNGNRRIIVSPEVKSAFRNLARPAAVGPLMEGDSISGVQVLETQNLEKNEAGANQNKPARGIVGPFSDLYLKRWDNAIFVSRRYEDGNDYLVFEMFWDMQLGHPALWFRFRQD